VKKRKARRERVAPLPAVLQVGGRHYFFFDLAFAFFAAGFFFAGAFFFVGK